MSISITIDTAAIQRLLEPGGEIYDDIGRRARNVLNQAVLMSPVDTGRMRGSGVSEPSADVRGAWDVTFPVQYSFFVNQGTRHMAPRPFLTDALPAALD